MTHDRGAKAAREAGLPVPPRGWRFYGPAHLACYETVRQVEGGPFRKVYPGKDPAKDGYKIAEGFWLPGNYADLDAAIAAFGLDDAAMTAISRDGLVTLDMVKEALEADRAEETTLPGP